MNFWRNVLPNIHGQNAVLVVSTWPQNFYQFRVLELWTNPKKNTRIKCSYSFHLFMEETEKCHIINCYKFSIKPFEVFEVKQVNGLNFLDFTSDFFSFRKTALKLENVRFYFLKII